MKIVLATLHVKLNEALHRDDQLVIQGEVDSLRDLALHLKTKEPDVVIINPDLNGLQDNSNVTLKEVLMQLHDQKIRPIVLLGEERDNLDTLLETHTWDFLITPFKVKDVKELIFNTRRKNDAEEYLKRKGVTANMDEEEIVFSSATKHAQEPSDAIDFFGVASQRKPNWKPVESGVSGFGQSRVYSITSSKGGVGKSTLAVNIAGWFVKNGFKTVIVDGDVYQGNISTMMKVRSALTLVDWDHLPKKLNQETVLRSLVRHASGLYILPSPVNYVGAPVARDLYLKIIENLKQYFQVVIVDLDPKITVGSLAVMEASDHVFFVNTPDEHGLERCSATINQIAGHIDPGKLSLVLNDRDNVFQSGDEFVYKQSIPHQVELAVLKHSPELRKKIGDGQPLILAKPNCRYCKELNHVIQEITGIENMNTDKKPKRWNRRFFSLLRR